MPPKKKRNGWRRIESRWLWSQDAANTWVEFTFTNFHKPTLGGGKGLEELVVCIFPVFLLPALSALCPFSSHPVEHLAVSYRSSCFSKHAGLAQARLSTATFQQTGLHGEGSPCPPFGWVFSSSVPLRCWVWAGNVTPWQVQVVVPSPASLQTAAQSADAPESLFPGYVQMSVFKPSLNCFVLLQMSLCLVPFRTVPQLCSILSNTYQSQNIDKVLPKTELFSQGPALFICLLVIG